MYLPYLRTYTYVFPHCVLELMRCVRVYGVLVPDSRNAHGQDTRYGWLS